MTKIHFSGGRAFKNVRTVAYWRLRRKTYKHTPKSYMDNCPFCKGYLIVRISKENTRFIGCMKYPKCRFTATELYIDRDNKPFTTESFTPGVKGYDS